MAELGQDFSGLAIVPAISDEQPLVRTYLEHFLKDADSMLAIPVSFPHLAESYSLQAAMYVDRQQLQSGRQADLVVRPRVLMAGKAIDPATLRDAVVTITATDRDGIATTKRFEKLNLDQAKELVLSLRVPLRLATLTAELSGKVHGLAKNDLKDLSASQTWNIASIRQTTFTTASHLTRNGAHWIIETRGRGATLQEAAPPTR